MAPTHGRYVDALPIVNPRPVEMEVICLGFSRTSTMSLYTALNKLGYKTYHFKEIFQPQNLRAKHMYCWNEALRAKLYGEGKPYGREELDKVLGKYSATTDAPQACFVDEMLAAYPNAKVVLTVRDPDKWLASVEASFFRIFSWRSYQWLCYFDDFMNHQFKITKLTLETLTGPDIYNREALKAGFLKHNEYVQSVVPPENLLIFQPQQGWAPLCKFLGKEVPNEPYPKVNEGSATADIFQKLIWVFYVKMVVERVWVPVLAAGVGWGVWRYGGEILPGMGLK